MTVRAYYNEIDAKAAAWLRELIAGGHIAPGDVDERSIADVEASDLKGYTQCHFFAGIGGWALALRLAAWPDDAPVWTGSCPCQPFSAAGKQQGTKDERHLWPELRRLVAERRPATVFGEQVAAPLGRGWLAGVRADLEALGYALGAADLCAAGAGAPHIRQRLFWGASWLADAGGERRQQERRGASSHEGPHGRRAHGDNEPAGDGADGGMGDAEGRGRRERGDAPQPGSRGHAQRAGGPGPSPWDAFDLVYCRDGKARRIEPGTFPLAHGVPGRVGLLRGYGNAIVPQVAAEFIQGYREARAGLVTGGHTMP